MEISRSLWASEQPTPPLWDPYRYASFCRRTEGSRGWPWLGTR